VTDVITFTNDVDEGGLLSYAAALEERSEHPIARGIATTASPSALRVESFRALLGRGVEGIVNGRTVQIVSPGYLEDTALSVTDERLERINAQGKTVVFVVIDGAIAGAIRLADIIRSSFAASALASLNPSSKRAAVKTSRNSFFTKANRTV
jgi:Cu2+-exporting ATPase